MRRSCTSLIGAFLSAIAVAGAPAVAQTAGEKVFRLGHLAPTADSEQLTRELTLPELATLGFVLGRNLVFDGRVSDGDALPGVARELAAARPDAIIAIGTVAVHIAREATRGVPIVMFADDPVNQGFAESFARPGGNVTGIANMVTELHEKRLQLLLEAAPATRRVAALLKSTHPTREAHERAMQRMAASAGVALLVFTADGPSDYPGVFAAMRAAGVRGLVIGAAPEFYRDAALLATLAREAGLPTSCEWAEMAQAGCLLGFGPNRPALRRRLAHFVARIFRGAAPSELPIERPTIFELAVNLKTAKALGLAIPDAFLSRADEVIE